MYQTSKARQFDLAGLVFIETGWGPVLVEAAGHFAFAVLLSTNLDGFLLPRNDLRQDGENQHSRFCWAYPIQIQPTIRPIIGMTTLTNVGVNRLTTINQLIGLTGGTPPGTPRLIASF